MWEAIEEQIVNLCIVYGLLILTIHAILIMKLIFNAVFYSMMSKKNVKPEEEEDDDDTETFSENK